MAVNVQTLADRLKKFEEGSKNSELSKLLWKPKEGEQFIRIVPYKYNPENPFIELKFYYKLAGGNYLAPCTFGKLDPVLECLNKLRESGSEEEKKLAFEMKPADRYYVPIVVRGEEHLGVRFWGFGVQVYKQLLGLMINPHWGDITSLAEGNDLQVNFKKIGAKKNIKTGQPFPDTTITPLPQKTPVVDPTRRDLMEKVKDQKNILDIFPLKSYDELKVIVERWLFPDADASMPDPDVALTPEQEAAAAAQASPSAETGATAGAAKGTKAEDWAEFFDKK